MKILKSLKHRLSMWTAKKIFKIYFGTYYYPFETADEKFLRMSKTDRTLYVEQIDRFAKSQAFKNEFQEIIRRFYTDLSLRADNEVVVAAHRLVLIFIRDLHKRFKEFEKTHNKLT